MQAFLVQKVDPQYPAQAREARIQGRVVLSVVVGKDGAVQDVKLVSGHPLLAPAAMNAVRQWHYKPYLLNGDAVEVQTPVTVDFRLPPS
jgi:protein TonB